MRALLGLSMTKSKTNTETLTDGWGKITKLKNLSLVTAGNVKRKKLPGIKRSHKKKKPEGTVKPPKKTDQSTFPVFIASCPTCTRRFGYVPTPADKALITSKDTILEKDCGHHGAKE